MVLILVHLLQVQSPDLDLEMAVALLYSLIIRRTSPRVQEFKFTRSSNQIASKFLNKCMILNKLQVHANVLKTGLIKEPKNKKVKGYDVDWSLSRDAIN